MTRLDSGLCLSRLRSRRLVIMVGLRVARPTCSTMPSRSVTTCRIEVLRPTRRAVAGLCTRLDARCPWRRSDQLIATTITPCTRFGSAASRGSRQRLSPPTSRHPLVGRSGEFPEPPPGEPDRAPQVLPTGTPGAFRGVLVHEADVLIEVCDVRVYADRIRFVVSIVPVGQELLRPEHSDPLPWPARAPHPDALALSVHLPDETTLEATLHPIWPGQTPQLILDDAVIGPSDATLRYWLIGRLPSEGPVTITCDWPAPNVSGTITAPIAALRAGL